MNLRQYATQAAENAGISPEIFTRLIESESSFRVAPRNYKGKDYQGIAQLGIAAIKDVAANNPEFARYASNSAANTVRYNPTESLDIAAQYLKILLDRQKGDYLKAVAAYKGGANNAEALGQAKKVVDTTGDNTTTLPEVTVTDKPEASTVFSGANNLILKYGLMAIAVILILFILYKAVERSEKPLKSLTGR